MQSQRPYIAAKPVIPPVCSLFSFQGAKYRLRPQLDELNDVNSYSKKYHHDQNPNARSEPIVDAELRTYVERTLALIG